MLPGSSLISLARPLTWVLKSGYLANTTSILRRTLDVTNISNILPRFNSLYYSKKCKKYNEKLLVVKGFMIGDIMGICFMR